MSLKPIATLFLVLPLLATVFAAPALAAPVPEPRPSRKEEAHDKGRTVVLGTWSWRVAGNEMGRREKADLFWQQVNDTERNLVPLGGAGWAILEDKTFEKVRLEELKKANYSTDKLPGSSLKPGTVVALRTSEGQFAKLKVVGYRDLHDTNFPEARHLSPAWIRFAQSKPNRPEYHLDLEWVLYKAR